MNNEDNNLNNQQPQSSPDSINQNVGIPPINNQEPVTNFEESLSKKKTSSFIIIGIIAVLGVIGLILGVKTLLGNNNHTNSNNDEDNYDIRVITDNGSHGWISSTEEKEYYLIDSSSGSKKKTTEFEIENGLSNKQIEQLQEIEKVDNKFAIDKYGQTPYYVFFYENFIFYTRYQGESGPQISEEDWQDMQENIYKFNIKTKQIEKISIKRDAGTHVDIKLEGLLHEYPNLEQAIAKNVSFNYSYGEVYYLNKRIFFTTYYATSSQGISEYLYEYIPANDETKKIFHYKVRNNPQASIIAVDVIK